MSEGVGATHQTLVIRGIRYHFETVGDGPPLLLLHGFMGARRSWHALDGRLAPGHRRIALDLLGHGQSEGPLQVQGYGMAEAVSDLDAICDALGLGQTAVLGYSMGGRLALSLALLRPWRVSRLILESASPGIQAKGAREARRLADQALARRLVEEGLPAFVEAWEQLPLFFSQRALESSVRQDLRAIRLSHEPVGLARSLLAMGVGSQPYWGECLSDLTVPTLLIAGDRDDKYRDLAKSMAEHIPRAETAIVADAGHNVHLEQPERFLQWVNIFLGSPSPPSAFPTDAHGDARQR